MKKIFNVVFVFLLMFGLMPNMASETQPQVVEQPNNEQKGGEEQKETKSNDVEINETNFPDPGFRQFLTDKYKSTTIKNISSVESLEIYGNNLSISSLEGIKLFSGLKNLRLCGYHGEDADFSNMKSLDLSNMKSLQKVEKNDINVGKTIDLRGCTNLKEFHHAADQETVYISAGMTKYIGCGNVDEHTGNVVVDLEGFYTEEANGEKKVDLNKVINPRLIEVVKEHNSNIIDNNNVMTIPANTSKLQVQAGLDNNKKPTTWTFFVNLGNVDDITVSYESNGGTPVHQEVIGINTIPTRPANPTKDNQYFDGWYLDAGLTKSYNFDQPLSADTTLYAKWSDTITYTIDFDSNGGEGYMEPVTLQSDEEYQLPANKFTREGYKFIGWSDDPNYQAQSRAMFFTDQQVVKNLATANGERIPLYAIWEKVGKISRSVEESKESGNVGTSAQTTVGSLLLVSLIAMMLLFKIKNNSK